MLRDLLQEVRQLGLRGTAFRVGWELGQRTGVAARLAHAPVALDRETAAGPWTARLPFANADAVAHAMHDRISADARARLIAIADDATHGKIRCFGRWTADFGDPIDWHRDPSTGGRWDAELPWARALAAGATINDVKLTWEAARFPQAYHLARAGVHAPAHADRYGAALIAQLDGFTRANPYGLGIHWGSGQETVVRLLAWVFALDALLIHGAHRERATVLIADALAAGGAHVAEYLAYARYAVNNNHLIAEALGLYAVGVLLPALPDAAAWRALGRRILVEEAARQFHADGGYLQMSHNYHRVALHGLLWAVMIARADGDRPDDAWLAALDRSVPFLVAHQNPEDGRLPNYGGNDGAMPSVLNTCDFSDFRPVLQAASLAARGERLYPPGPWDETSAWMLGPTALDAPLRPPVARTISFVPSGFHVLRGRDPGSFATFRCGTVRIPYSQIDMLHLDVWWRGQNVLVDGGSYLYNGPAAWHDHFVETGAHNTVTVDGRDQMVHHRRFKNLYWTDANLLAIQDPGDVAWCTGEHRGYARHPGGCVHRRSVVFAKDDLWIVVDHVRGEGRHRGVLHWLGGDFPYRYDDARLTLTTPRGPFSVAAYDLDARPLVGDVVAGATDPPRGWLARYYGEKVPVPSLRVGLEGAAPLTWISVLGAGAPALTRDGDGYAVGAMKFTIDDGTVVVARG